MVLSFLLLCCHLCTLNAESYNLIRTRSLLTTAGYSPRHSIEWNYFGDSGTEIVSPNSIESTNNDVFRIYKPLFSHFAIYKQPDVSDVCVNGESRTDIDSDELEERYSQLRPGWFGSFQSNDFVLASHPFLLFQNSLSALSNPITLAQTDISGVVVIGEGLVAIGAQIQANDYDDLHTVQIDIYDSSHTLLQTFYEVSSSLCLGDGSAQFIGIQSERSFYYASFSVSDGVQYKSGFAINTVDYVLRDCKDPTRPTLSCFWYNDCLEHYSLCGPDGYALGYGFHFCSEYNQNLLEFSALGQQWINEVMECLQLQLVPIYNTIDQCDTIQQYACNSHPDCYVGNTNANHLSVCDLTIPDWGWILWTVSVKGIRGCGPGQIAAVLNSCGTQFIEYFGDIWLDIWLDDTIGDIFEIYGFLDFATDFVDGVLRDAINDLFNHYNPIFIDVFAGSLGIRFLLISETDQFLTHDEFLWLFEELNESLQNQTYAAFNSITNRTYTVLFKQVEPFVVTDDILDSWMYPYNASTNISTPTNGCFIGSSCTETNDCCPDNINERSLGVKCQRKDGMYMHMNKYGKICCIEIGFSGCSTSDDCCGKKSKCLDNACVSTEMRHNVSQHKRHHNKKHHNKKHHNKKHHNKKHHNKKHHNKKHNPSDQRHTPPHRHKQHKAVVNEQETDPSLFSSIVDNKKWILHITLSFSSSIWIFIGCCMGLVFAMVMLYISVCIAKNNDNE